MSYCLPNLNDCSVNWNVFQTCESPLLLCCTWEPEAKRSMAESGQWPRKVGGPSRHSRWMRWPPLDQQTAQNEGDNASVSHYITRRVSPTFLAKAATRPTHYWWKFILTNAVWISQADLLFQRYKQRWQQVTTPCHVWRQAGKIPTNGFGNFFVVTEWTFEPLASNEQVTLAPTTQSCFTLES